MTTPTPAGWYDDGHGQLRWWDGQRWTEHTAPPTAPTAATASTAATAPTATSAVTGVPARPSVHVPMFGARKVAKELAAKLDELGAMSLVEIEERTAQAQRELAALQSQIGAAHAELQQIQAQLVDVRNTYSLQEVGLYDFAHPAENSATLAASLERCRAAIKDAVKSGHAVTASQHFTFNNSVAQGRKFVTSLSKAMLAAYNAEAENCVKAVRAGNLQTAQARLVKAATRVEDSGRMIDLKITEYYQRLRLDELALAAQHLQAVQAEKEQERAERERLREERRVEEELRRQRERLEKERQHYQNALAALRERGDAAGVADLEAKIADVDRAIADVDYRAANVRCGYVYVISNIGSFGEGVVKIGMTRRQEPRERVDELGDASVPFRFDIHALFFVDDAVSVEAMLHQEFADRRVNKVNNRREFFYCTPEEVLAALQKHNVAVVEYRTEAEAPEFRLSGGTRPLPQQAKAVEALDAVSP
jgi:hypothetical protein